MKLKIEIIDKDTGKALTEDELLSAADIEPRFVFEDIAIQSDGVLIVCDKCGHFGYLDDNIYEARITLGSD